jgi:hypothetical protein
MPAQFNRDMLAQHAQILCGMTKSHEFIEVEIESNGSIVEARCFSGRDPTEIANFAAARNIKGHNILARIGASLIKSAGAPAPAQPFRGSVRYSADGGSEVVGAPRVDLELSKASVAAPQAKSFLKMRGFA